MLTIEWKNETTSNVNSYKASIKKAIESTLLAEKVKESIDISFVFVCDEQIRKINKKYRKDENHYGRKQIYRRLSRDRHPPDH